MYYSHHFESSKLTESQIHAVGASFLALRKVKDVSAYLMTDIESLWAMTFGSLYRQFLMPKDNGEERIIHMPSDDLKEIQRHLNHALQCVYYGLRPASAYGFMIHARRELSPRNIYSHAARHLRQDWVLNLDIKDFYPSITFRHIKKLLRKGPFRLGKKAAKLLAMITTLRGVLPAGAPTSPILANFVALPLDQKLQELANNYGLTFTRFSDDLVFSGKGHLPEELIEEVGKILANEGFELNTEKQKLYENGEQPSITGLVLKENYPDISREYMQNLKEEMRFLKAVLHGKFPAKITRSIAERLRRSIQGQINFVGFIRGRQHKTYLKLQYQLALVMAEMDKSKPIGEVEI